MMAAGTLRTDRSSNPYLRGKGNRRVRKRRLARSVARAAGVAGMNLALLAALAFAGRNALERLSRSQALELRHIEIIGLRHCPAEPLRERLAPFLGANLLEVDLDAVVRAVASHRWIQACAARRVFPHTLRLEVVERVPFAVVRTPSARYLVDESGSVLGTLRDESRPSLPVITGIRGAGDAAVEAAARPAVRAVAELREAAPEWLASLEALDVSRSDRITAIPAGEGPRVLLDPDSPTRNLADYLTLRRRIHARVGPSEYVDLRWRDRITVMPEEVASLSEKR